jgi:hypothetical protein
MRGAIPPFPNMPSWRGPRLRKHWNILMSWRTIIRSLAYLRVWYRHGEVPSSVVGPHTGCPDLGTSWFSSEYVELYIHSPSSPLWRGAEWNAQGQLYLYQMEVSGQLQALATSFLGKRAPGTHWIGGWVGPWTGLDTVVKRNILSSCREFNPDRPARSLVTTLTELSRLLVH